MSFGGSFFGVSHRSAARSNRRKIAMQTTKGRSALHDPIPDGKIGTQLELSLDGLDVSPVSKEKRKRAAKRPARHDELFDLYQRRIAGRVAPATVTKYAWTLEQCLRLAEERTSRPVSIAMLLTDGTALGYVCSTTRRPGGGLPISAWTAAHRRTVLRSVAGTLAPELRSLGLNDAIQHVDLAIRRVAERVGGGSRLPVGTTRNRGRPVPSTAEVSSLLNVVGSDEGWAGQRNALFYGILAATGSRVGALLVLDGQDLCLTPDGAVRLSLHDKASGGRFELELPDRFHAPLDAYFEATNLSLTGLGKGRVGFGRLGPVWRGPTGDRWPAAQMRRRLRAACRTAGIEDYTPHSFRAYFATQATNVASRRVAALAGGWRGTERMDDHYVGVKRDSIERKLAQIGVSDRSQRGSRRRPAVEQPHMSPAATTPTAGADLIAKIRSRQ